MALDFTEACCEFTKPFEGESLSLYLDGDDPGNVTGGVGILFPDAQSAADAFGVSPEVMQPQFAAVKAARPGLAASAYAHLTTLRLTLAQSAALFRSAMEARVSACQRKVAGFDALPQSAQIVCVDLEYNVTGGVLVFHHFLGDLGRRDWKQAAIDCHRVETPGAGGVQPARNAGAKALIESIL